MSIKHVLRQLQFTCVYKQIKGRKTQTWVLVKWNVASEPSGHTIVILSFPKKKQNGVPVTGQRQKAVRSGWSFKDTHTLSL